MVENRSLVVVADDLGVGPETSEGILELARLGIVKGTVLLTNSPHASHAVRRWCELEQPCDLGWHPNLTLDSPVAPVGEVSTLVNKQGSLWPLREFLGRLLTRRIRPEHVARELGAQYQRFRELSGRDPLLVNSHQHVALFPPVGVILRSVLRQQRHRPWLRRVQEKGLMHLGGPGVRLKRLILSTLGRLNSGAQVREGFPGAGVLSGIGSPTAVDSDDFFCRWVRHSRGELVELMCHPGKYDPTLLGRDAPEGEISLRQRVCEFEQLKLPVFSNVAKQCGFALVRPSELVTGKGRRKAFFALVSGTNHGGGE